MNREQEQQNVSSTLKKLNALSEETCAELTVTTKIRKITERDHSIKAKVARAKEQSKQPTVAEGKKHRMIRSIKRALPNIPKCVSGCRTFWNRARR